MKRILCSIGLMVLMFLAVPYLTLRLMEPEVMVERTMATELVRRVEDVGSESRLIYSITEAHESMSDFERYLVGVVAAEMPALFHIEALKAQAVASRTYALYSMKNMGMEHFDYSRIGEIWQAYISEDEMRLRWGNDFNVHFAKITEAVYASRGEILMYEGEPIVAVFHAFSGGMTEYSENVWNEARPYLRSVNSDFYSYRADFIQELSFSGDEFLRLLRVEFSDITFGSGDIASQIIINHRTIAGYITSVTVGNKDMDGALLRRLLGLRSTNFEVSRRQDRIVFEVRGHGHGAGMSQVGANALAGMGYDYAAILKHYYFGVEIVRVE